MASAEHFSVRYQQTWSAKEMLLFHTVEYLEMFVLITRTKLLKPTETTKILIEFFSQFLHST